MRRFPTPAALALVVALAVPGVTGTAGHGRHHRPAPKSEASGAGLLGRLPLRFEPNRGQTDPEVRFTARTGAFTLFLTPTETVFAFADGKDPLRMSLAGANPGASWDGVDPQRGVSNYVTGSDQRLWQVGVPGYGRVIRRGVYPGVDVSYHPGAAGAVEYDLVVGPGADPSLISLSFAGARHLSVDDHGDLLVATGGGVLRQHRPVIYQTDGQNRRPVSGGYVMRGDTVGFRLGAHDPSHPLVIDPTLAYGSYLGGSLAGDPYSAGWGVAADAAGFVYVTGITNSVNFPTKNAFEPAGGGGFVAKFDTDAAGDASLVYSTFNSAFPRAIAVDGEGNAWTTGSTSAGFPTTPNAYQPVVTGDGAYAMRLSALGIPTYSTFIASGGGESIAVDQQGRAYITGSTSSQVLPTSTNAAQAQPKGDLGDADAFFVEFDPAKSGTSSLVYGSYLGGGGSAVGQGVAVAGPGRAYVLGHIENLQGQAPSSQFHLKHGLSATCEAPNSFLAQFDTEAASTDGSLVYSTCGIGVSGGVAADSSGNAYVLGRVPADANLPSNGGFQTTGAGGVDAYVAKMGPGPGQGPPSVAYATYLGGTLNEDSKGGPIPVGTPPPGRQVVAADAAGNVYVAVVTQSTDFPVKGSVTGLTKSATLQGGNDIGVAKIDTTSAGPASLAFSFYLGGSRGESAGGIAVDPGGNNIYLVGTTRSQTDFPHTAAGFRTAASAYEDLFVVRFTVAVPTIDAVLPPLGPTSGGTRVTITGQHLAGATAVRFGDVEATGVTPVDEQTVTAISPAHAEGVVDVRVTTGEGSSAVAPAGKFTYVPPPTVSAVNPARGPSAGGTVVQISGTHLVGTLTADFGGVTAPATALSDTEAQAVTPAHAPGPVDVRVTAVGGTSAVDVDHDRFTYVAPPTVSAITPDHGPVTGGTVAVVSGTGFEAVSTVQFGSVSLVCPGAACAPQSDTALNVVSPPQPAGTVDVTVTALGGTSPATDADHFTYEPAAGSATAPPDTLTGKPIGGEPSSQSGQPAPPAGGGGTGPGPAPAPGGFSAVPGPAPAGFGSPSAGFSGAPAPLGAPVPAPGSAPVGATGPAPTPAASPAPGGIASPVISPSPGLGGPATVFSPGTAPAAPGPAAVGATVEESPEPSPRHAMVGASPPSLVPALTMGGAAILVAWAGCLMLSRPARRRGTAALARP